MLKTFPHLQINTDQFKLKQVLIQDKREEK